MTDKTKSPWGEWAPFIAIMITVAGATWTLSAKLSQLEAKVEQNTVAIERNARATAQAVERNAQAIAEVQEALANLTGQYVEHVRHHNEALTNR